MILKTLRYTLVMILIVTSYNSFSQSVDHWETIVRVGDSCQYFVPDSEIGTSWKETNFIDNAWDTGQSGFGYGDDDDNTILPEGTVCVYLRYDFDLSELSDIAAMYIDIDYDDGFVAYLNGVEVARANIIDPISWNMELENDHEASMYSGINPERFDISEFLNSTLITGKNILAVEVHNVTASSSDMSANVFLHAGVTTTDSIYGPVPDWFGPPVSFKEFNLPLMIINTNEQEIPDDPRIVADMGIIDNGNGVLNKPEDPWNAYSGKISIERRGKSSYNFEKKSYSIELQNEDGSNNNVSILGLPEENDFVLYGPYSDKTMIKNVLTYELFRRTGRWAPRTRYVEIILNDEYRGVYVLTEKLKRDKNRVDIDKITPEDVTNEEISGGYILRRDKTDGVAVTEWWRSSVDQPYHETMWYQYFDPRYSELTVFQSLYIRKWMEDFDETMSGEEFAHPQSGYRKYIRTKSFIDMMFINEISKGIDNYLFSTYFYKENDNDGGQLVAGPPWDYNLGYGNLDYGEGWDAKETYGWCYPQGSRVYWYERLMEDEIYRDKVYCRWSEHRAGIFSDENIIGIIDSCVNVLGDAIERNYSKYPTLGKYIWPAIEPIPETYEEEVFNLKEWLIGRLAWMDDHWLNNGNCNYQKPSDLTLSNSMILDTDPKGTLVGVLNTIDTDSEKHYYSLVSGKGDEDNSKFTLKDNLLLSNATFEEENATVFKVRVESVDDEHGSIEQKFEINLVETVSSELIAALETSFVLYPNPSSDWVRINLGAYGGNDLYVQLIDLSGKVMSNYVGGVHEINENLYNDSKNLGKGLYMIKLKLEEQSITRKFIKI